MSIKEKFEKGIYTLEFCPLLMYITGFEGIFFHKNAPYPDEIEALENVHW
jgi:hypothetical protein